MLERFNPSLYTEKDARAQVSRVSDRNYTYGSEQLDPGLPEDQAKIWSLKPDTLSAIQNIVENTRHVHYFPFVMGTYNMRTRQMRMNDACITDPYSVGLIATGALEGFAVPALRALYYVGRKGWWRHESIHARHHHQMADFLAEKKGGVWGPSPFERNYQLNQAGETIHESGIEEIVTRWQALKESDGIREKAISTLALALYMEYAPFTGLRNAVIDAKEASVDKVDSTVIRRSIKLGIGLGSFLGPLAINDQLHFVEGAAEALDESLPVSQDQIESAFFRGIGYIGVAVIGALLSSKEKGEYAADGNEQVRTTEYKFPYVYNPVASTVRSIDLLRYINRVWDEIPNFRQMQSKKGIDGVKREIEDRTSPKLSERDQSFTMRVVEDALSPLEKRRKSSYPQDVYVKGMFTPALYLNLRERYRPPADQTDSSQEHEIYSAS